MICHKDENGAITYVSCAAQLAMDKVNAIHLKRVAYYFGKDLYTTIRHNENAFLFNNMRGILAAADKAAGNLGSFPAGGGGTTQAVSAPTSLSTGGTTSSGSSSSAEPVLAPLSGADLSAHVRSNLSADSSARTGKGSGGGAGRYHKGKGKRGKDDKRKNFTSLLPLPGGKK